MSYPEDEEASLIELGINVQDYLGYRASQLAEILPSLKSILKTPGRSRNSRLAA
jgi:hypothetical protein